MSAHPDRAKKSQDQKRAEEDAHRDPLSGRAGAHPVGTGLGAAAGGMAVGAGTGAVVGSMAGPVGTAVGTAIGAAVGAVGGGLAGKAIAEKVDPTVEHGFWRGKFSSRPYVMPDTSYEDYAPAYEFGWQAYSQHEGRPFEEVEADLARQWHKAKGKSQLEWDNARHAARDAWNRLFSRHEKARQQVNRDADEDPQVVPDPRHEEDNPENPG